MDRISSLFVENMREKSGSIQEIDNTTAQRLFLLQFFSPFVNQALYCTPALFRCPFSYPLQFFRHPNGVRKDTDLKYMRLIGSSPVNNRTPCYSLSFGDFYGDCYLIFSGYSGYHTMIIFPY